MAEYLIFTLIGAGLTVVGVCLGYFIAKGVLPDRFD